MKEKILKVNFWVCFNFYQTNRANFPNWIRICMPNADPDCILNADPDSATEMNTVPTDLSGSGSGSG